MIFNLFKVFVLPVILIIVNIFLWLDRSSLPYQYQSMWLLPMTFILIYILLFIPMSNKINRYKITFWSFYTLMMIRLVIIPLSIYLSKNFEYLTYVEVSKDNINLSIYLLVIEAVISSTFLHFYLMVKDDVAFKKFRNTSDYIRIKGSKGFYILFIIVSTIILLISGKTGELLNFIIINVSSNSQRFGDASTTYMFFLKQIIFLAAMFTFLILVDTFAKEYRKNHAVRYYLFALMISMTYIGLIIGERRSNQLYIGVITILVLNLLFPHFKKITVYVLSFVSLFIILLMSIYKHFYVFRSGSYIDTLQQSNLNLMEISNNLQLYALGLDNVGLSIQFSELFEGNLLYVIYENIRSIFGMSFLLNNDLEFTSSMFNSFVYNASVSSGHLLSSAGYGYIHLGTFFFMISIFNLLISLTFENLLHETNTLELKFLYAFVVVRFATNIFSSTPALLNLSSIVIISGGILYTFSIIIKKSNKIVLLGDVK